MLQSFAADANFQHPALPFHGWWNKSNRLIFDLSTPEDQLGTQCHSAMTRTSCEIRLSESEATDDRRPVLIAGGSGTLGQAFAKICEQRNLPCCVLDRQELDITNPQSIEVLADSIEIQEGRQEGETIGIEKGEAIGIEKGQAIGRIQLLQELLGASISKEESLRLESLEQLSSTLEDLQAKLRERNA